MQSHDSTNNNERKKGMQMAAETLKQVRGSGQSNKLANAHVVCVRPGATKQSD